MAGIVSSTLGNIFDVNRLRKATLLALFALASMQLAMAGHQFDHAAASAVESCHVCVQADRLDDLAVDAAPQTEFYPQVQIAPQQLIATTRADASARNFNSRAPPQL